MTCKGAARDALVCRAAAAARAHALDDDRQGDLEQRACAKGVGWGGEGGILTPSHTFSVVRSRVEERRLRHRRDGLVGAVRVPSLYIRRSQHDI